MLFQSPSCQCTEVPRSCAVLGNLVTSSSPHAGANDFASLWARNSNHQQSKSDGWPSWQPKPGLPHRGPGSSQKFE
eukprot:3101074-Amphidinium_carterae.1